MIVVRFRRLLVARAALAEIVALDDAGILEQLAPCDRRSRSKCGRRPWRSAGKAPRRRDGRRTSASTRAMTRRCSVMRMPLAAQSASMFARFGHEFLPALPRIACGLARHHRLRRDRVRRSSGQIAAQHQRGGGLPPALGIIVGPPRPTSRKSGAGIEPARRRVVLVDLEEHRAHAEAGEPAQMQSRATARARPRPRRARATATERISASSAAQPRHDEAGQLAADACARCAMHVAVDQQAARLPARSSRDGTRRACSAAMRRGVARLASRQRRLARARTDCARNADHRRGSCAASCGWASGARR